MRRIQRKDRKKKNIILFTSLIIICSVMIVGYSTFNTNLSMNAKENLKDYENNKENIIIIAGGGDGSGYIGNTLLTNKHMACYNCEESNEESTKTVSVACASESPTKDCGKIGNGYARITYLGK